MNKIKKVSFEYLELDKNLKNQFVIIILQLINDRDKFSELAYDMWKELHTINKQLFKEKKEITEIKLYILLQVICK